MLHPLLFAQNKQNTHFSERRNKFIATVKQMLPDENAVIVNLHNWNGEGCISRKAHEFADKINVALLTIEDFYVYINVNDKKKKLVGDGIYRDFICNNAI